MKKIFLTGWLVLILSLTISLSVHATTYSEGYFYYTVTDESVTITGYFGKETEIKIPVMIAGYPVNTIASGAFNKSGDATLYLPDTITTVEEGAIGQNVTVVFNYNVKTDGSSSSQETSEETKESTEVVESSQAAESTQIAEPSQAVESSQMTAEVPEVETAESQSTVVEEPEESYATEVAVGKLEEIMPEESSEAVEEESIQPEPSEEVITEAFVEETSEAKTGSEKLLLFVGLLAVIAAIGAAICFTKKKN